jgi:cobalt-zinc-cadmium efflux system membrane fusion protein
MKYIAVGTIFLVAVLSLMSGCGREAKAQSPIDPPMFEQDGGMIVVPGGSPLREQLSVTAIAAHPVWHEFTVPATAEADPAKLAKISPPLAGRVVKLFVHLGEAVKQGDPLFAFDSADLIAAQSDYLKAKSADVQAERIVQRQKDLRDHGIGAEKDFEQVQTDREVAHSELERAGTRLHLLGMNLGDVGKPLTVRAPIAGRIIDLATAPGQYWNDPTAVVMTVADLSSLWVAASVPENDIQRVTVGEEALVDFNAYPGQRLTGKVLFIGEILAPETRTVKVRIQLDNAEGRLKPGMFARVTLRGTESPELVVPPAALQLRGEKNYLFVENAPWKFERRAVEVGDHLSGGICVTAGLIAGERVVTAGTILMP